MTIITVKTGGIAADAVTDAKIADDVVGTEHLTANEVDTAALKGDAVTGAELADNAVNSEHYTDGSIDTVHLADGQVTIGKLATAVLTGATDIGAAIVDADLFLVDDGAGGTLRKTAASRLKTFIGGGITMADAWRTSATATFSGAGFITANWERVDTDQYGTIGTGVSESSGVFTFPATGIYLIQATVSIVPDGIRTYTGGQIHITVNNSDFNAAADGYQHTTTTTEQSAHVYLSFIFDVTNTSNDKVKLKFDASGSGDVVGNTAITRTGMTFIRLGDT